MGGLTERYCLPGGFAQRWAALVGYSVKVRCVSQGPGRSAVSVSVPVEVPNGHLQLVGGTRGGRARYRLVR